MQDQYASECSHSFGLTRHSDGTIHQACQECGFDAGAGSVLASGYGWGNPCSHDYTDILPERPVFWDAARERDWFDLWVANQIQGDGYVSPEAAAMTGQCQCVICTEAVADEQHIDRL